ncbi:hypothetical protein O181_095475 [Austropuccinia psidii MF-1]|uniref:Periodic tryptophan protein 1 homolog n=1 Tax=Austropuccinia psidii MF-1 TaxID=1389203 RepID=A0A9Q3J5P5_9BASI|nr:hypothetical protein [Austropuccinia psidii MF-1]
MASLISSTVWVRRGIAAQDPKRYTLDENELERVSRLAGNRLTQVKEELIQAQNQAEESIDLDDMIGDGENGQGAQDKGEMSSVRDDKTTDDEWTDEEKSEQGMDMDTGNDEACHGKKVEQVADDLALYNLDDYDKEESKGVSMGAFSNIKGLEFYENPSQDPYVTLDDADELEEREELEIYPTDNLLVAAKTEDDVSQLEIYVYDQSQENLYVHHDILLPAMPLCLEWIDFTPAGLDCEDSARKGNFIAVGTMDPEIEIWSLDIIDGLYPNAILGQANSPRDESQAHRANGPLLECKSLKKKKKKKTSSRADPASLLSPSHHTSSVLSLSHNKLVRNLLLSSSADTTVKLWDLNLAPSSACSTFSAIRSFNLHQDKVQTAQWNPQEPSVVISGGWDRLVKVWDSRNCQEGVQVKVESDVECIRWNPFEPNAFLVTLDNGHIQSYDSRMLPRFTESPESKALWTLSAHDSAVSAMDVSSVIPGLFVTGGLDRMVKVWNLEDKVGLPQLSMVVNRDLNVGKVFSVGFCPDDAMTVAVAGSEGTLQIWDLGTNHGVRAIFGDRLKQYANIEPSARKTDSGGGVIGLKNDSETDEEED